MAVGEASDMSSVRRKMSPSGCRLASFQTNTTRPSGASRAILGKSLPRPRLYPEMAVPSSDFTPPAALEFCCPAVTTTGKAVPPTLGALAPAGTFAAWMYTYGSPLNRLLSMLRSHARYVSPVADTAAYAPVFTTVASSGQTTAGPVKSAELRELGSAG